MGVHPPPEQRPRVERQERRLVRPAFGEPRLAAGGEPVELRLVVDAQAAERGQVVAALEHIDRVDLEQSQPVDERVELTDAGRGARPTAEALRRQGDAAGERGGE
ncbi:MAG TPA: hypothetical protein VFC59_06735 [Cryobacterium sp.]|nr:hypothetical protein [Cryobacterium sp.]